MLAYNFHFYCQFLGAALAWKDVFHKMGQVSNLSGLKYVLLLKVETDHFDATLINGDLVATTHHLNKMVTYLKELIPHLKNKSYQLRVGEALMRAEMLVAKLSTGGGTIRDIDDFFKAESRICNSHLTQLLEGIIDLVEGVLEVTGVLNLIR